MRLLRRKNTRSYKDGSIDQDPASDSTDTLRIPELSGRGQEPGLDQRRELGDSSSARRAQIERTKAQRHRNHTYQTRKRERTKNGLWSEIKEES